MKKYKNPKTVKWLMILSRHLHKRLGVTLRNGEFRKNLRENCLFNNGKIPNDYHNGMNQINNICDGYMLEKRK